MPHAHTTQMVVAPLEPLVPGTRWSLVDRAGGAGPGVLVSFDARMLSDPEAQLARVDALDDPRLVRPIAHGVDDGAAWLLYPGTLEDSLAASSGPLALAELADFGDAILLGLGRAHLAGLVHPGLVRGLVRLVTEPDGRVVPEVLGLGLPVALGRSAQDDVTDVAVILYELFAARSPWAPGHPTDGSTPVATFREIRPSTVVPATFEAAILRQLGPRPGRFHSAAGLRAALLATPIRRTAPVARPGGAAEAASVARAPTPIESLPTGEAVALPLGEVPRGDGPRGDGPRGEGHREEGPRGRQVGVVVALMVLSVAAGIALVVATAPTPKRPDWTSVPTVPTSERRPRDARPTPAPAPTAAEAVKPTPKPKPKPLPPIATRVEPAAPTPTPAPLLPAPHPTTAEAVKPAPPTPAPEPAAKVPSEPAPAPASPPVPPSPPVSPAPPSPREPTSSPAPAPAAEAAPPEPSPAAEPKRRVRITTTPDGVSVLAHGKLLGTTPLVVDLPVADLPLEVVFEKKGYRSSKKTLVPVDDVVIDLQLEATDAPPARNQ